MNFKILFIIKHLIIKGLKFRKEQVEMNEEMLKKIIYELYKVDWEQEHKITPNIKRSFMIDYYKYLFNPEAYSFQDYLEEFGYDGELYLSFEDFLKEIYFKEDYVRKLINDDEEILDYYLTTVRIK